MRKPKIGVIIPVYNEAETIGKVLDEALALPPNDHYILELLVVDGGSKDATAQVVSSRQVNITQQKGRGYGAACYTGFLVLPDCDYLAYLDGDYSDPPAALPLLLQATLQQNADVGLGLRNKQSAEKGALAWHAQLGNQLVIWLINLLYRQKYSDLPSFKVVRRALLEKFEMQEMTYGWTTEMLVKAARAGCKILEVEVGYRKRAGGKSKVSGTFKGTVLAAYHLLRTAWHYRKWNPAKS